ncbi:MAG: hypothetical protein JWO13_3891 [Acidobacteriales bacterium]|nr:hypothetical protein [Terriglobales bacterium]
MRDEEGEDLERAVLSLGQRCDRLGPVMTFREGGKLFARLDDLHSYPARSVCPLSLTMARAARWSRQEPRRWVAMALDAAKTADDGPLIARCWVEQATTLGQDSLNRAVGAGAVVRGYLTAAAVKAGSDNDLRARAQYRLAYEHAAIGEWKEARVALSHAETAASHAGWSHSRRGAMAGSSLWVMDELSAAEFALSDGMGCEGSCRLWSLAWLARVHLDSGDADAALEDILQADWETRDIHRRDLAPQLRAVAGALPANLRTIAFDHLNSTEAPHEIRGVAGWFSPSQ